VKEIRDFGLHSVQQKFLMDSLREPESSVEEEINKAFQQKKLKGL